MQVLDITAIDDVGRLAGAGRLEDGQVHGFVMTPAFPDRPARRCRSSFRGWRRNPVPHNVGAGAQRLRPHRQRDGLLPDEAAGQPAGGGGGGGGGGAAGLVPGRRYTIEFAVRPLAAQVVAGVVGDPTGLRWGLRHWQSKPVPQWQFFRRTLRATQTSETVGLVAYTGSQDVLFDGVRVVQATRAAGPSPPRPPPPPLPAPGARATPPPPPSSPLIHELGVSGGNSQKANNVHWRLSIWKFMLEKTAHDPVFGVRFRQADELRLARNDLRRAHRGQDEQPGCDRPAQFVREHAVPHGAARSPSAPRAPRDRRTPKLAGVDQGTLAALDRAFALTSVAMVVAVAVAACFSVALEGPYIGLFFWLALGLVLALPRLLTPEPSEASD